MAIKILSKDIYDLDNNKLKNNKINGVDYEENDCGFVTDYRIIVNSSKFNIIDNTENNIEEFNQATKVFQDGAGRQGYASIYTISYRINITIPKKKNKDTILKIYNKTDNNGNPNIRCNIIGNYQKGKARYPQYSNVDFNTNPTNIEKYDLQPIQSFSGTIQNTSTKTEVKLVKPPYTLMGTVEARVNDNSNLDTLEVRENENNFYLDCIVTGVKETYNIAGAWFGGTAFNSDIGVYEKITAKELDFTIYGDLYKFNIETGKVTIGENPNITLDSNELLQKDTGVIEAESDGSIYINPIGNWLSEKIIGDYNNGKETAELLCQIGEYYYENDTLAISTKVANKPMTFEIGDIVIPYIYNSQGQDVPMSLNKDGTAKQFRVTGVDFIYDGAVWQKLTLQEV